MRWGAFWVYGVLVVFVFLDLVVCVVLMYGDFLFYVWSLYVCYRFCMYEVCFYLL